MADEAVLTNTSDMIAIHETFRPAFGDAPGQIQTVSDGDKARAGQVAAYLGEVFWLLHAHHEGEDTLLYPLLRQRAPEHMDLFDRMEAEHASVSASLDNAARTTERFGTSGSLGDGREAAEACRSVLAATAGHLGEEEEEVLPIAARVISPAEWGGITGSRLIAL